MSQAGLLLETKWGGMAEFQVLYPLPGAGIKKRPFGR
jgi:hypothetical protein